MIRCILSLVMMIYLGFALVYARSRAEQQKCQGVKVQVLDPAHNDFITVSDVLREMQSLKISPRGNPRGQIDLRAIERDLTACDNIERVNCVLLSNDTLTVEVQPMVPLARVFDRNDREYFINRTGKIMKASEHYRIDVPVVLGHFTDALKPTIVLPYIDYFTANPGWDRLVAAIEVKANGDIIMVPSIRGHVVNLGDTADIDNKFLRLKSFYSQVMPVKGWQYYDTISVKWRSRVIASKRGFKPAATEIKEEEYIDIDDSATMTSMVDSLSASAPRP